VYLSDVDVVRHRLVQKIILAFARGARSEEPPRGAPPA
jgi:phosphate starvation-inducible protein PhoH